MFIETKAALKFLEPIYGRQRHCAPDGANEVSFSSGFYKHCGATRLEVAICD